MEDHNSSLGTWDYDDRNQDYDYSIYLEEVSVVDRVVNSIIVSSGLPLCAVAVYVLYSLVRLDGGPALVYVFNLLMSDMVQICCLFVNIRPFHDLWTLHSLLAHIHFFCVVASVVFMVCIALERYLLVVWPLWYRFKRPTRTSVVVSVLVWIFCAMVSVVLYFHGDHLSTTIFSVLFLLPIPLFLFCLGGTLRALSACRLPADEKRRIVELLVLVLLIYILFFLPAVVTQLAGKWLVFYNLPFILVRLNPLADLFCIFSCRRGLWTNRAVVN